MSGSFLNVQKKRSSSPAQSKQDEGGSDTALLPLRASSASEMSENLVSAASSAFLLQQHQASSRAPRQEYSRIQTYDPKLDIINAHQYVAKRRELRFWEVFRYAQCLDWLLMLVGVILALGGSLVTPWLYYWGGVTLHDVLIFDKCEPRRNNVTGECLIPHYCDTTLEQVGFELFQNFLWGWIIYNVIQLGYCICFTVAADRQTKAMRAAYFESIVRKDMAWFDLYADKDFAKDMTEQITHIRLGIGDVIPNFINLTCTVAVMVVLVFFLNMQVAFSFLGFIPLCMLFLHTGNWAEQKRAVYSDKMFEKANRIAKESLVNIKLIKMYEAEKRQTLCFSRSLDEAKMAGGHYEVKWMALAAISSGSIWLLLNVATSLIFWLGHVHYETSDQFCERHHSGGLLTMLNFMDTVKDNIYGLDLKDNPGEVLMVYFGLMYLTMNAMQVSNFLYLIQIARKNATSVFFLIDWKSRIDNTSTEGKMPKRGAVGRLDFYNVTFRYPQKPDLTVLNIRQLTIYGGQFVAFAGPENSGKNTILKLIPRLYDVCSGFIALDAVNLQNLNIHWLRRQMCIISETPVIFSGTISENILFGKLNASEEEIIKACRLAELHHVIEKLPNGYNTRLSSKDFGDPLTRNEKRQLCLARAYLHRSRLILLDNPIVPEDDDLEPLMLKFVHYFRDTATVILASTHVTALSKRADCIYYMENGRILEAGNHIQLIQSAGLYYSRLEGTMNCSVESRGKFESQLKAYKYSQLLQKKRKSSIAVARVSSDNTEDFSEVGNGGGDEPRFKKGAWGNILKRVRVIGTLKSLSKQRMDGETGDRKEGSETELGKLEPQSQSANPHSILRSGRQLQEVLDISSLEESYSRYQSSKRKSRGGGGNMHLGFGMMGLQRMNFARPMTNYSTQIQKQRHAFRSTFGGGTGGSPQSFSLTKSAVGQVSFLPESPTDSLHPSVTTSAETVSEAGSHTGSGGVSPRVKFSFVDTHDQAHEKAQSNVNKKKKGKGESKDKEKAPKEKPSKSKVKIKNKSGKAIGAVTFGSDTSLKSDKSKSNLKINPKGTSKQKLASTSMTELQQLKKSESVQNFIKEMTQHGSFHLKEHVEIDNVSVGSQELDSFLQEYDEGVFSALNSDVKGFWRDIFFVVKHDWPFIIPAMIASVILGLSIPYQTWVVGTFFQTIAVGTEVVGETRLRYEVMALVISIIVTGVVTAVAAFTQEFCFSIAGRRMTRRLREQLFEHILNQDLAWFDEKAHDIGILSFQLYADAMVVHHVLLMAYGIIIQAVCNVLTSMAFAAVETPKDTMGLTLGFILLMPLLTVIVYLSSKKELNEIETLENRFKVATNFAQEFLMNIKTWFSLGAEVFFIKQHKKILDREYTFIRLSSIFNTTLHTIVQTSSWLLYGLFIYSALKHQENQVHVNPSHQVHDVHFPTPFKRVMLIGFIMIATELLIFGAYRVGDQIAVLTDVEMGKVAAHKIMRILVKQMDVERPPPKVVSNVIDEKVEELYQPPPEIGLTNISYIYPGVDPLQQENHLRDISMTISSTSYVAIVGPPGSGKSTLCNILLRMCEPSGGVLDFNGDDCYYIDPKKTRRLMGLVEYDPSLFDFSILQNIQFGKCRQDEEPSRIEVEEATKLANCHFDILDLPEDYNTLVGAMERTAQNFSLKQRISYARALLRKPKILIVDDATTSIDVNSDNKILDVLANARENRTLIVFSHKIEPIRDADTIFVLWEGQIVETGSDSFLLAHKGYYYEMYMTQRVLADSMRNSPQQMHTIRYNITKATKASISESKEQMLADMAAKRTVPRRKSDLAFVKFLDEKVKRMKAEKAEIRKEIERELPELEMEEKERELQKHGRMSF